MNDICCHRPGDEEKAKDDFKSKRKPVVEAPKVEGVVEEGEEGGAEWETVEKKGMRGEMTKLDWKKVLFGKDTEVDQNAVAKKRQEIVALRGKKVGEGGGRDGECILYFFHLYRPQTLLNSWNN